MKIIKTKEIVPSQISEIDQELKEFFSDRNKIHNGSVPSFFAYIQDHAWEAFLSHGNNVYKTSKHEAQGILLGKYFKDEHGEFIIATKYAEGNGNSTQSFVEMTEECLANISIKCQNENLLMLIWLHTHPGFGVFYSGTDVDCLKTNFYKEFQLGIVVDILKKLDKGYKVENRNVKEFKKYLIVNTNKKLFHKPFDCKYPIDDKQKNNEKKSIENLKSKGTLNVIESTQYEIKDTIKIANTKINQIQHLLKNLVSDDSENKSLVQNFKSIEFSIDDLSKNINEQLVSSLQKIESIFGELKSLTNENEYLKKIGVIEKEFEKIELQNISSSKKIKINSALSIVGIVLISVLIFLNIYFQFR